MIKELELRAAQPDGQDSWVREAALADWIRALPERERTKTIGRIRDWIEGARLDRALLGIGIAEALGDPALLEIAILEAERQGIINDEPLSSAVLPDWLAFKLRLLGALTAAPTPAGMAYLRSLRDRVATATGRAERRLSVDAWLSLAFIERKSEAAELREAMKTVRRWDDPKLSRAAEGLIIGLWIRAGRTQILRESLTPSELKRVMTFASK